MIVKIYTNNPNCYPCKVLKGALEYANIDYNYNVVSNDEIVKIANKYNYIHVPIVTFDDNLIVGDHVDIVNKIKELENE